MRRATFLKGLAATLTLGSCSSSKFLSYSGPEVTRIVVFKGERRMYLLNENRSLKAYDIDLGFAPDGHKQIEGDGKTPEGHYIIDRRNPNSEFYLSLGISYPNENDRAKAAALGQSPGGDIFIHGAARPFDKRGEDWTWGCISVSNREMEKIYSMVEIGTPISLYS